MQFLHVPLADTMRRYNIFLRLILIAYRQNTLNIEWAKDLRRICENFKKNPPEEPRIGDPPKGAAVDKYTYTSAQLFGNIVSSLLTNGYLNLQQAVSIFEKAHERAKVAYGDALIKTW